MSFGGESTQRGMGLARLVTILAEGVGLLNKGSASAPAAPAPGEAGTTAAISTNSLNVTRVSGVGAVVATVGAAAIALFNVEQDRDRVAVVVAAYASTGLIVAAALITVAIIVAADIRQRGLVATAPAAADSTPEVIEVRPPRDGEVTLDTASELVLVDASRGDLDVRLPGADREAWKRMTLGRADGAAGNDVTVRDPNGGGEVAHVRVGGGLVELYSNGSTWRRCESNGGG